MIVIYVMKNKFIGEYVTEYVEDIVGTTFTYLIDRY